MARRALTVFSLPTKVKQIQSVVLTAGDYKAVEATDAGVTNLIHELIEDHTLG